MMFTQYSLSTGALTGRWKFCSKQEFCPQPQDGFAWVEGMHDPATHRVDLATGEVVPKEQP
jgi:hypothetical protein